MAPGWDDAEALGGFPDDYIFTFRDTKFGFPFKDEETGELGNPQFWAEGERNVKGDVQDGRLPLSIGDFEPGDKEGTFAMASDQDEEKRISKQSKFGKFFLSALEIPELKAELRRRAEAAGKGDLVERYAPIWNGIIVHVHENATSGTFRQGPDKGQKWEGRQPVIVEYLGTVDAPASSPSGSVGTTPTKNGWNAESAAKEASSFIAYVEEGTSHGIDPSDPTLTKQYFESVRS